jgi:hypothetical protein
VGQDRIKSKCLEAGAGVKAKLVNTGLPETQANFNMIVNDLTQGYSQSQAK